MNNSAIPDWLNKNEYPFASKYFATDFGKIHYIDEGKGDPVVFVHGNPSWSFEFRNVIKELKSTHRCIAPDHLGFGFSDKPQNWSYLPKEHAKNFSDFINSLNLKNITLVIGDWGGPIGLNFAVNNPEKIKGIIIANTWAWPVNKDWYYRAFSGLMGGFVGKYLIKVRNSFAQDVVYYAFGDKSKLSLEVHKHYLMPFENPNLRKPTWVFPGQIIGSTEWIKTIYEKLDVLKNKKIVLFWGLKDIAFRKKELNQWTKIYPQAKLITFKDAGHFMAEEKPKEMADEIRMLG